MDKISLISIITLILFVLGIIVTMIKTFSIRKIKIHTKKGSFEIISFIILISIFTGINLSYVDSIFLEMIFLILVLKMFFEDGITNDGIAVSSRGKCLYKWNEINDVVIIKKKNVKITYWTKYFCMRTAKFRLNKYDEIIDILDNNEVEYKIENN